MLLLTSGKLEEIAGVTWVQLYAEYCSKGEEEIYDHHRDRLLERIKRYKYRGFSVRDALFDYWADQPWDGSGDPSVDYAIFNKNGRPLSLTAYYSLA